MAGELINKVGTSGWVTLATGLALTADTFAQVSASDFATLFAATESDYPEFELRVEVTAGTIAENDTMQFNLRMSDGTNQEQAPNGNFAPHFCGIVTLDDTGSFFFSDTMSLKNKLATLYVKSGVSATVNISARMLTVDAAA